MASPPRRSGIRAVGLALAAMATAAASGLAGSARANGTAQPDTVSFHADADAGTLAMNTTFGFLFSEDGGATWGWTCHEAVIGTNPFTPRPTRHAPDGSFFVTTPIALGIDPTITLWRTEDDGCSWIPNESLRSDAVRTLAFHPDGVHVLAVGSQPGGIATVWRSSDGGVTFGDPLIEVTEHVFNTVHYAPSNPLRAYVAALKTTFPQSATLYRSDDGGDNWTPLPFTFVDQPPIHVLAVDPDDADIAWLRNDAAVDRVYLTTNGGSSFALAHSVGSDIQGMALTDAGDTRWIAIAEIDGILRSTVAAPAFESLPGSPIARCVSADPDTDAVYACAHPYSDPWAAAVTTDGATFDTAMSFTRISGPLSCPGGSSHVSICEPLWPQVAINLGLASPTPTASAAPSPTPSGGDGGGGGCGCSLGSADSARASGWIGAIGTLAVLVHLRRRRL